MGGGDARRVHFKKKSEKPAKRSKSENYCWTELVLTSTAPPFGKGQLKLIRVQFCWWNEKKLVSLGGRRKEGRKVSLAASGRTRLCQERGWRQWWQVRGNFSPHRPLWLWRKSPGDPGDLCKMIPCNKQGPKPFLKSARMHFQRALWQYQ